MAAEELQLFFLIPTVRKSDANGLARGGLVEGARSPSTVTLPSLFSFLKTRWVEGQPCVKQPGP